MAPPGIAISASPEAIGPYCILRELGRGGMGQVYEAVHDVLEKRVAIKTLRPHLVEDAVSVQRFLREGRAACHVEHPNVVNVHELGSDRGVPYLVMELLEGEHLGARLRRSSPLPLDQLVETILPVISAVCAAHAAGIVHRDLKPSNIMLSVSRAGTEVPKVLDFGTSKLRGDREPFLTLTGAVLGTLHYMSPEQTLEPQNADSKSDQYSLGVILYECSTGRKPFVGQGGYELMHAIMTAPVAPPSSVNPALPIEFDSIVMRAMSRAPRHRYPSVREFGAALLPFAPARVADAYRAEFTANPAPVEYSGVVEAGWEKGTESEPDPAKSIGTWIDPSNGGAPRRWKRPIGAAVLSALTIAAGFTLASAPHSGVAVRASAAERKGESRMEQAAAGFVSTVGVVSSAPQAPSVPPTAVATTTADTARSNGSAPPPRPQKGSRPTARSGQTPPRRLPMLLGDNGAPILE